MYSAHEVAQAFWFGTVCGIVAAFGIVALEHGLSVIQARIRRKYRLSKLTDPQLMQLRSDLSFEAVDEIGCGHYDPYKFQEDK